MSIVELIGLFVIIVTIGFSIFRKRDRNALRKNHPEKYAEAVRKKEAQVKTLLDTVYLEEEHKYQPSKHTHLQKKSKTTYKHPKPPIKPAAPLAVKPAMKVHKTQHAELSQGRQILKNLKSKKEMVILSEIIAPPKSLRKE